MVQPNSQVTRPVKGRLGARFPGAPFDRGNLGLDPLRDASKEADPGGLPRGVDAGDLDTNSLLEGRVQTGGRGDLVFVAQPLAPRALGVPVVVVSERIGLFPFGRLGTLLFVAAAVAAAAAAGVSVWLVRRLTRPLAAMERTARAIAAGDLRARVEDMAGAEDELAALGEAIDTMAAELERARGLERAFLMSVSHDLRTPLTSIRGYAEGRTRFLVSLVGSPDGWSRRSSAASSSWPGVGDGSTTSRRTPVGPSWSSRPDRGTPGD